MATEVMKERWCSLCGRVTEVVQSTPPTYATHDGAFEGQACPNSLQRVPSMAEQGRKVRFAAKDRK